ncbi:ROK family protein [Pontibacter sp. G13]|uniref:ROK family protein n=1 Tax=Pontibacter sp. G13 TaxID=3074898 RepID=UPI00288B8C0F|nr:ROK family protein [Pontibacter sp. G13]WNJ20734.1 ROK family protein [Pontibacter sp. G13]
MKSVAIGIDIGGTNTKYGIVDPQGNLLASSSISTSRDKTVEEYVQSVHDAIQVLIQELDEELEIQGVGIGAPNANYYTGTIEYAPNLAWKGVVPIADLFGKFFDVPIVITNDANAAAVGEMIYGGATGMKNFCVITLGTGVGSGFVVNGDLVYGHDGFAGEFGHVTAIPKGRLCTCGRLGCVETYASARGVVLTVQELLAGSTEPSALRKILPEDLTPKDVFDAAESGDQIAIDTFNQTGKILGRSLADLVAFLSPQTIFIFGGVARAGDWILEPTKRYMEDHLLAIYKDKVNIVPSKLPESDAAILGASSLVWQEIQRNTPKIMQNN